MEIEERRIIYQKAYKHWGSSAQKLVAIEELSELINELAKNLTGKDKRGLPGLIDEIADSKIMIEQLEQMYEIELKVYNRIGIKLLKLDDIIENR